MKDFGFSENTDIYLVKSKLWIILAFEIFLELSVF